MKLTTLLEGMTGMTTKVFLDYLVRALKRAGYIVEYQNGLFAVYSGYSARLMTIDEQSGNINVSFYTYFNSPFECKNAQQFLEKTHYAKELLKDLGVTIYYYWLLDPTKLVANPAKLTRAILTNLKRQEHTANKAAQLFFHDLTIRYKSFDKDVNELSKIIDRVSTSYSSKCEDVTYTTKSKRSSSKVYELQVSARSEEIRFLFPYSGIEVNWPVVYNLLAPRLVKNLGNPKKFYRGFVVVIPSSVNLGSLNYLENDPNVLKIDYNRERNIYRFTINSLDFLIKNMPTFLTTFFSRVC